MTVLEVFYRYTTLWEGIHWGEPEAMRTSRTYT